MRTPHNRKSPITPESQLQQVVEYVRRLQEDKFYGQLTLDFQSGNILRMDERKSIMIGDPNVQRHPRNQK